MQRNGKFFFSCKGDLMLMYDHANENIPNF